MFRIALLKDVPDFFLRSPFFLIDLEEEKQSTLKSTLRKWQFRCADRNCHRF